MIFTDKGVIGADVSFYQDDNKTPQQIDFTKMVSQGASFVVIRAGQGGWIDEDFSYNWGKAKNAGLPRGSYWFYDDRYEPITQANRFADLFSSDEPELELWVDLEKDYGGAYPGYANWKKFLNQLKLRLPNAKLGIYTGYYYITGKIPLSEYAYFAQFSLWIAWYTSDPSVVKIPQPWTSCTFWQWGTPAWGLAWGCESLNIDMNKFNGTQEEFKARYGLGEVIPPGGGMDVDVWLEVTANYLNGRDAPAGNANLIYPSGQSYLPNCLTKGDLVHAIKKQSTNSIYWYGYDVHKRGSQTFALPASMVWSSSGLDGIWLKELPPEPPAGDLPAYFIAYDQDGNELGRYAKE